MRSMLSAFPTEKLKLHKRDGSVLEVTALVSGDSIATEDIDIVIEEDDIYERVLPNGTKEYFCITDRGFVKGNDRIPDSFQSKVRRVSEIEPMINVDQKQLQKIDSKPHKLFISHSSDDKEYMVALVELLEDIGMPEGSFVCTTIPGYGIPGGEKIFDWLRDQFLECDLRVLFALSHNYYDSPACLNEMGAAWVTKASDTLLLLPGFDFGNIRGCIDPREMGISFGMPDDELKHRLNEFKETICDEHHLPSIIPARWERHRDKFIARVLEIATERNAEKVADNSGGIEKTNVTFNTDSFGYPSIQAFASVMLFFATENTNEPIIRSSTLSGTDFYSGGKKLNKSSEAREQAKWDEAIQQLVNAGYIELVTKNKSDQIYKVTNKGFNISDCFKNDNSLNASMTPYEIIGMFE